MVIYIDVLIDDVDAIEYIHYNKHLILERVPMENSLELFLFNQNQSR
jgi:hypothetical protein